MTRAQIVDGLERLARKYRELAALRARREQLEHVGRAGFPDEEIAARRDAFRRVAGEFPGALRELDTTPARVLAAKQRAAREELAALAAGAAEVSPGRRWLLVTIDYHDTLRELLAMKLWLARRLGRDGAVTPEVIADLRTAFPGATLDDASVALLRHPPGGRVHPIVWRRLGERHGLARVDLERAVFDPPPDDHD